MRAPRRRLRRRDDRDAPAGADAQVHEDLELPRAAQQGDQAQVQRRGRLSQRRLGRQARRRPAHGGERPVGRDVQGLPLDRRGGARGEAGGARRDSKGAGEAHVRGLAGGGGGCEFTHRFGLDPCYSSFWKWDTDFVYLFPRIRILSSAKRDRRVFALPVRTFLLGKLTFSNKKEARQSPARAPFWA